MSKLCKVKIEWNGLTTSLLSWTEDMGCYSFSIPAGDSCPMAVYEPSVDGKDSICGGCYAQIGRYGMPNVADAQWIRFMWLRENLKTENGRIEIFEYFREALQTHVKINGMSGMGYFRGHDSGDFFSPAYVDIWIRLCSNFPGIKFWFPTRSYHKPGKLTDAVKQLAKLPNVIVRPSALWVDTDAPQVPGFAIGSGVVTTLEGNDQRMLCPKTTNGGTCESNSCRTCWNFSTEAVYYYVHGAYGRHKLANVNAGKYPANRLAQRTKFTQLSIQGR
jgi:hypothetical protein